MTSEGVPFKYNPNNITHQEAVKISGLIYELVFYSKKTLDDFKRTPNYGNITIRLRLKSGLEIIVVQGIHLFIILEQDFFLITHQLCKIVADPNQQQQPQAEGDKKI
jgi:hypothetical protein